MFNIKIFENVLHANIMIDKNQNNNKAKRKFTHPAGQRQPILNNFLQ